MGELAQLITAIAALIAALVGVGTLAITVRNSRTLAKVQVQTNGLLAHAEAAATAKGKVSGIAEGKRQGLDQAAADRSRE